MFHRYSVRPWAKTGKGLARRTLASVIAICAAGLSLSGSIGTAMASSTNLGSCITAGQQVFAGQYLASGGSNPYLLFMQNDGNFVAYTSAGQPVWDSQTAGHAGASAALQASDGNLVVYSSSGQPLWTAYIGGNPGDHLCIQTDGNLVVYASSGAALWATGTSLSASQGATLGYNPGLRGQCTWWAEEQFHGYTGAYIDTNGPNNGNAKWWAENAARHGWTVGSAPRIGSIAVFQPSVFGAGKLGHVAWVTAVYPSRNAVTISEMNFTAGFDRVDNRTISPAVKMGLQYVYVNP